MTPIICDYNYKNMSDWGRKMFVTPGIVVDGKLVTTDLVDINLEHSHPPGQFLLRRLGRRSEMFVKQDPLGNPVDQQSSLEPDDHPHGRKSATSRTNTPGSCRRAGYDKRTSDHLALDTGGGPIARLWSTALAGLVDIGYVKSTGTASKCICPRPRCCRKSNSNGRSPSGATPSSATAPARTSRSYAGGCGPHFIEKAMKELHAGNTKTWTEFKVPDEAIGCGFHEAVRGVLSHHVVIRKGKIANYHPYPPTPWNANPRDIYGTPGPVRRRGAEHADLRGKRPRQVQGNRHHAGRPQFRSVPALRRAHVPRQRQDAGSAARPRCSACSSTGSGSGRPCLRQEPRELASWVRSPEAKCAHGKDGELRGRMRRLESSLSDVEDAFRTRNQNTSPRDCASRCWTFTVLRSERW